MLPLGEIEEHQVVRSLVDQLLIGCFHSWVRAWKLISANRSHCRPGFALARSPALALGAKSLFARGS